jgi:hypothetical protein
MATYTPSYPAVLNLKGTGNTDDYAQMTFIDGRFDISTTRGMSDDGVYNDYASMTFNGQTLNVAVNLQPYEQLIQVTNGNYSGAGDAPLAITSATLDVNVALTADSTSTLNGNVTVGNNASLTLTAGSVANFNDGLNMLTNGSITFTGSGNVALDSGNVSLATGDVNVDAGDVNVTLGDLTVSTGDVIVADEDDEAGLKNIVAWLRNTFGLAKGIFASP